MADHYEEAPPLPRGLTDPHMPTVQNVDGPAQAADVREALPPPPKFPSLTDVALPVTQSPLAPEPSASASSSSADPAPGATHSDFVPPVEPSETTVASDAAQAGDDDDAADHDTLHDDIMAAIQRDAVVPGTGARRATEIGRELWTVSDQQELDRLLAEGQDVYVPPDVGVLDLPVARASGYAYVPVPPPDAGVDASPDQRSMADRIAVWNQVVPQEHSSPKGYYAAAAAGSGAAAVAAGAAAEEEAASKAVEATERSAPTDFNYAKESAVEYNTAGASDSVPASPVPPSRMETPVKSMGVADEERTPAKVTNADVSKSIFGGMFYTVPVVSRKYTQVDKMAVANTEDSQPATMQGVVLQANSSACVNVLDDYGLKGGHDSVINDAAFMHADQTLITCGADGKVCIWDMSDRSVQREFVPYEGEPVTMVYPLPDDDEATSTIMTLSQSRLMRIWCVDETQAVMLRSNQIKTSENDLYMSVPVISKQLKARAIAAAAAAAVSTSDTNPEEVVTGVSEAAAMASPASASTQPTSPVPSVMTPPSAAKTASMERVKSSAKETSEDETRKRFSLKMFGGRGSRGRAVAS